MNPMEQQAFTTPMISMAECQDWGKFFKASTIFLGGILIICGYGLYLLSKEPVYTPPYDPKWG